MVPSQRMKLHTLLQPIHSHASVVVYDKTYKVWRKSSDSSERHYTSGCLVVSKHSALQPPSVPFLLFFCTAELTALKNNSRSILEPANFNLAADQSHSCIAINADVTCEKSSLVSVHLLSTLTVVSKQAYC